MNPLLQELLKRAQTPTVNVTAGDQPTAPGLEAIQPGFKTPYPNVVPGIVSDMTSPLGAASMAAGPAIGMLRRTIPGAVKGVVGATSGIRQAAPTLGETAAEFAPVGGEAAYNAGRAVQKAPDLAESLYQRMMSSGRGNVIAGPGSTLGTRIAPLRHGPAMTTESIAAAKAARDAALEGLAAPQARAIEQQLAQAARKKFNVVGSETGSIDPKLLLGGVGVGAAGYAGKKLYDLISRIKDPEGTIQKANPFGQVEDILNKAGRGNY